MLSHFLHRGLWVSLMVCCAALSHCSTGTTTSDNPEVLYKDAEDDIKNDRYILAHEKLNTLKNKFPYSKYAIFAQLRIADVYFKEEAFIEAGASYQTFRELHPNHEKVPYAMFQTGESYFLDIPDQISRDLSSANRSLTAFDAYIQKFPFDENVKTARERIVKIREILAEKELYIGNFYFKRDQYLSSKGRYERMLETYPQSSFSDEAKEKLDRSNKEIAEQVKRSKEE